MRLGFHYHIPAYISDGKIITMAVQGLFIDSLAPFFSSITLFLYKPVTEQMKELDYTIQSTNIELVSLMKHYPIPFRIFLYPFFKSYILSKANSLDVFLLRGPTPLLPLIAKSLKKDIKIALLIVGEMIDHVDNIQQPQWRKELIRIYVKWNEGYQKKIAGSSLVFANSQVVYEKYKQFSDRCFQIKTTTLKVEDFFERKDVNCLPPVQLLFSGRIDYGKGILDIIEALHILLSEGYNVNLNIVGWTEPGDNIMERIEEKLKKYEIGNNFVFHGKKKIGKELFSYYRNSDIFIIASQVAEGFPRTIWEALANSLPVIATAVGSIPYFLKDEHDILLVEPRRPDMIAHQVKRLIETPKLRQKLIRNGLKTVSDNTLDIQAKKMSDEIEAYVGGQRF